MRSRSRSLLFIFVVASFVAPALRADWHLFLPTAFDSGAHLDLWGIWENDERSTDGRKSLWKDDFLREKLTFFTNGYVYHPRFLQYRLSVTGVFSQESYKNNYFDTDGYKNAQGYEYEARVRLLPYHPYSFELYSLRFEPLFRARQAARIDNVATDNGALFEYRKKPFFLTTRYANNHRESGDDWSTVETASADGQYYKEFKEAGVFSLSAGVSPKRYERRGGFDGDSFRASAGNGIRYKKMRLDSTVSGTDLNQNDSRSGDLTSRYLSWREQFGADLPGHLTTLLTYSYQDSSLETGSSPLAPRRSFDSVSRLLQLGLSHRLYESLDTNYSFQRTERESRGSSSTLTSNTLGFNYLKRIPGGRLMASAQGGRSEVSSTGANDITDELHPGIPVPGGFLLDVANADLRTLVVFLVSPIAPFETVQLSPGIHYSVAPVGDSYEVTVSTLPPQFAVPESYDFKVSYALLGGRFTMRTDSRNYRVSLNLFDDLLEPYISRSEIRAELVEGALPGVSPDSTTSTVGLSIQRAGFRVRGEYQNVEWEVSPYHGWLTEGRYNGSLGPATTLNVTALYRERTYPRGRSAALPAPVVEAFQSASARLQQRLFRRTLLLSIGGAYTRTTGYVDSTAHGIVGSLSWRVGKLDLLAGSTFSDSETSGTTFLTSSRSYRYYYFRIRRDF